MFKRSLWIPPGGGVYFIQLNCNDKTIKKIEVNTRKSKVVDFGEIRL